MDTKLTILIVDDDQGLRKTLSDILRLKGYKTIAVDTGWAALVKIAVEKPAVALIDLKLEDMSGLDLLKTLKQQVDSMECILLTGYASQASAIEAVNLGAYGYIQKPYDIEQLLVMIRRAVEKREAKESLGAYARRLETLREIDQAILEAHSSEAIAQAALRHIRHLAACRRASVITYNFVNNVGTILAVNSCGKSELAEGMRLPLEAFTISKELEQGQVRVVEDIQALSKPTQTDQALLAEGIQAYVTVPLIAQGELIGALNMGAESAAAFAPGYIDIAQEVASLLAVAIQQARLNEQVQRHAAELEERVVELQQAQAAERKQRELAETLREVTSALNTSLDRGQVLNIILEQLARVVNYDSASVMLLSNNVLQNVAGRSLSYPKPKSTTQFRVETVAHVQDALNHRGLVIIADTTADPRWVSIPGMEHIRCWLGVPLVVQDRVIGLLNLSHSQPDYFTEQDAGLAVAFAAQAAIAVENAQLFEQAQEEIEERMRAEAALEAERASLARRVEERTAELSAANAELAKAARLKDEFLAAMSHELRTPLNAVLGLSEVLQEEIYGPLNERQLNYLRTIEESGRHLLALINDILDVSKIEAGKLTLDIGPVSVEAVCQASLRLIKQSAHKKRLEVSAAIDSTVTTIQADQRRLKQILVNLLSNAVKFTPAGQAIGLEVKRDEENQIVHFTVWDTGIGIAPEDMGRLFKPFMQLDSSLARQHSGTGLGLTLVSRLAELHGGRVSLESQPGQGSRFTVSLPWPGAYETREEIIIDEPEPASRSNNRSSLQRALVVEGSPAAAEQLTRYLTEMGIKTVVQPRAAGALEKAQTVQPDVIILDILLPDLSGWEVLNRLKQDPLARNIPVVIVSVVDEPARGLALDAAEYLVKPISRQQLQASLSKIFSSAETETDGMVVVPPEPPLILVVEDNLTNIEAVTEYLQIKGYQVIMAHNGQEAIKRAREDRPDIILMDIQMPGMDGLEAIKRIRSDEIQSVATASIIALTALSMPGDRERCLQAGANEYVSKPINLRNLVGAIERHLA